MKFKDSEGKVWPVKITLKTLKDVNRECGINLGEVTGHEYRAWSVRQSPLEFVSVIYEIVHQDVKASERMDPDEFAKRLWGKSYGEAQEAYWEAYLAFCPPPLRETLKKLVVAEGNVKQKLLDLLEQAGNKEIDMTSLMQLLKTQESSESREKNLPRVI